MGNLFSRDAPSSDDRTRDTLASPLAESTSSTTCTNDVSEESSLNTQVFQQFYNKLVETLPMDDPNFTAKLYSARLLSSYLKEYVESRSPATRTEKATRFLDQVIKPSVTSFDKLLHVMEDSEYQHVKELAEQIGTNLSCKRSSSNHGNFLI